MCIESYPEDKYLPSYLVYSRYQDIAFYILIAADVIGNNIRVITGSYPEPAHWSTDLKTRRK